MKIAVVIVTYNRIEKLKKALACYDSQSDHLNSMIIVNNNSSDGTGEFLCEWEAKTCIKNHHVISLPKNLGGSGGFYTGQSFALSLRPDWIFVADDDAYPEKDLFEKFEKYVSNESSLRYGAICAKVINRDNTIAFDHRCRVKIKLGMKMSIVYSKQEDYADDFDIDVLSYVGSFLNAKALETVGLCEKDFFIYADDVEHSLRIKKYGLIKCVPSLEINHDSGFGNQNKKKAVMSWRDFYLIRNNIYMRKKHFPMTNLHYALFYIAYAISKMNVKCLKLTFIALKDGFKSRLGTHCIYKPGYEIQ